MARRLAQLFSGDPTSKAKIALIADLHVSAGAGTASDKPAMPFPLGRVTTDLSPQKSLEFMLFDIASCVIDVG